MSDERVAEGAAAENSDAAPAAARGDVGLALKVGVTLLAGAALALALFLTWQTAGQEALPPGCGEGSGCGEVLSSRYGKLLGLPVSGFAAVTYTALLVGWFSPTRWGGWLVAATSAAIIGSAGWFVWLQLVELNAICAYCMIDHGLGVCAALWALAGLGKRGLPRLSLGTAGGVGGAAAAAMIVIQLLTPTPIAQDGVAVDAQTGSHFTIGNPEATHRILLLFDYACPHCRDAHEIMFEAVEKRADVQVALVPMAIHPSCNSAFNRVNPRFEEGCEIATLALAVQEIDTEAFVTFDRWLFEWERFKPRTLAQARAQAEELVDADRLAEVLASGSPAERLTSNIALFQSTQARRVPVVLIPGQTPIVGEIYAWEQIERLLDDG